MSPGGIKTRVAGVFIQDEKILLVRHEKDGRSYWLLPGGGLEYSESFETALERELMEEANLVVKAGRLLFIAESLPPDGHRHVINLVLAGEIISGEAKLNEVSERLKEVAWVPRADLASMTFQPDFKATLLRLWDEDFAGPAFSLGNVWLG